MKAKQLLKKHTLRARRALGFFTVSMFTLGSLMAQDYELSFVGSGEYDSVESVLVENLTQGTQLTLAGNKVLHLVGEVEGPGTSLDEINVRSLAIYPNPSEGPAVLDFSTPTGSMVSISVHNLAGSLLMNQVIDLEAGEHTFSLPAMASGIYLVSVKGDGFRGTAKWISKGGGGGQSGIIQTQSTANVEYVNSVTKVPANTPAVVSEEAERVQMQYNDDDLLRLTAKKGNCTTIMMKRPRNSFEVDFYFMPCTDAEGKHYAIVKVGDLMWMAEDLTASKRTILVAENQAEWTGMDIETAGMAYYGYKEANKNQGTYYNYQGALAALPEGWRLPSAGEVQDMVKQLKQLGDPAELLKAKNNDSWNTQSKGLDETSFGAEANGNINTTGAVVRRGTVAAFWTKNKTGNKGYPMEIGSGIDELVSLTTLADLTAGYAVRGVVDAPSAYNKLLGQYFNTSENRAALLSSSSDDKLLGDRYVITEEYKDEILFDAEMVTALPLVREACGQVSEDGTERPVMVTYENNKLNFLIYNADLSEKKDTRSITLVTNSTHADVNREMTPINTSNNLFTVDGVLKYKEFEARWDMQVISKDLTGDGIGDFVVAVYNKVVVVDGATFDILTERTYTVTLALRIGLDDLKEAGNNQLFVLNGSMLDIFDDPLNLKSNPKYIDCKTLIDTSFQTSEINIGDVIGNGKKQIVLNSKRTSSSRYISIIQYDAESNDFKLLHKFNVGVNSIKMNSLLTPSPLVHFRGRVYPADIVYVGRVLRYNSSTQALDYVSTSNNIGLRYFNNEMQVGQNDSWWSHYYFSQHAIVGNFDKNEDGKEQLKLISEDRYGFLTTSPNLNTTYQVTYGIKEGETLISPITTNSVPKGYHYEYHLAAVNTTGRSRVLEFKSKDLSFSEPRIHALLAAPPYHGDYDYSYDMGTSWGKSAMTGKESENANTVSGSVIFGFEMEFNAPIVGTKIGGVDFTTKLTSANTSAFAKGTTLTKSNTFTTWHEDAVVLTAIPYETHTYTILKSYNADEVGSDIIIGIPKASQTLMITLNDFEELTANDPKVPNLRSLFKHTVGKPFTYPNSKTQIVSNADSKFVYYGGTFEGNEFVNIGSGGNLAREIALEKEQAESSSSSFAMEMELVVTAFGVKAGGGFGYENSNTSTSKVGEGHTIAGIVAGLNKYGDRPEFKWNVTWFNYKLGGQTFPVVYYIVQQ